MQVALFITLLLGAAGGIAWLRLASRRATPEETRRVLAARAAWIATHRTALGLSFGGALIAVVGVAMWAHAMVGETLSLDLARLEAGEATDAPFVAVRGYARPELATCRDSRGSRTCRTPLTSTPGGRTIAVLVSSGAPVTGERADAGMISSADRWGFDVAVAQGLTVAPGAFVLLRGETPEERRPMGLAIFACGAAVAAVGLLLLQRAGRRRIAGA